MARRRPDDHGGATIEMVVVFPAVLALMFLGVQGAVTFQGRQTVLAAAGQGARSAAAETGTTSSGIAAAQAYLDDTSAGLTDVRVTCTRTGTQATVTVSASTTSLVPGWQPRVEQSATLPVERLTS